MLTLRNLVAGYGKVEVLHGISIDVPAGAIVALIGPNGAGKTTTMRAICGMVRPTSGVIRLDGRDITGLEPYDVARRGLAHVPEGRRVFPSLSVLDNLLLGAFPRLTGTCPRGDPDADLTWVMSTFPRLRERRRQLAGTLSGGEQQMLATARAMMLRPQIMLFDEPSLGLAPQLVEEVFRIIRGLKAQGVTMLLVEQFAAAALEVADAGYVLERGRIVVSGAASDLRHDRAVRAAYLGLS